MGSEFVTVGETTFTCLYDLQLHIISVCLLHLSRRSCSHEPGGTLHQAGDAQVSHTSVGHCDSTGGRMADEGQDNASPYLSFPRQTLESRHTKALNDILDLQSRVKSLEAEKKELVEERNELRGNQTRAAEKQSLAEERANRERSRADEEHRKYKTKCQDVEEIKVEKRKLDGENKLLMGCVKDLTETLENCKKHRKE